MASASLTVIRSINNFPAIRANFPRAVSGIIRKGTFDTYSDSQITVPVRRPDVVARTGITGGALKASGQVTITDAGMTGEISYTIYYAVYVHEGTVRMPARPFLTNALDANISGVMAAFGSLESRLL